LKDLSEVEVCFHASPSESWPGYVFLLAGWLSSRLAWRRTAEEQSEDASIFHMRGAGGDILLRLIRLPESLRRTGLRSVKFSTRNGASFSVDRHDEDSCLSSVVTLPGAEPVVHTVPCPSLGEADLLIGELSLQGEDVGFRAAFEAAMDLEQSLKR
jgi:hypothetical protein